jgi:ubiquinone/menaquinone biosynthesis C-methylase UbiE
MILSDPLEFTGERFTPECVREIWYEHMHRYALAGAWCAGKRTLDAACGEGYGSAMLAGKASSVEGVDISGEAVAHARKRYGQHANLQFQVADCTSLPFADDEFDRVVSFETLEHLEAQEQLLQEFRRVLKPDGLLVLSSPDKAIYTDQLKTDNEFHVKELYRHELEELIARHFPAFRLLGQKLMFHSAIWSLGDTGKVSLDQLAADRLHSPAQITQAPMYFIAVCAAQQAFLPATEGRMWLFDDHEESVYRHYHEEVRRHIAAGGIIADLQKEVEQLKNELAGMQLPKRSWWRRLAGKR